MPIPEVRRKSTDGGSGTTEERQQNIRQLMNFFPVIAEDEEGRMMQIDERQVLSIPRKIKREEEVRRGFMSNLLFRNITNIFSAPAIVGEILMIFVLVSYLPWGMTNGEGD